MPATIRPATPADAADIHRLIVDLATYERSAHRVELTADELERQLASPTPPCACLVATVDEAVVGFALYFPNYSTWTGKPGVWLEDLYVDPALRGSGIGRRLLQALAALTVGGGRLEWPVLDWNEPAHGFYRAIGANPLDEWATASASASWTRTGIT